MSPNKAMGGAGAVRLERDRILGRLVEALDGHSVNVLLAGPWGCGKTTLIQELEHALKRRSAGRKYHVLKFSPWSQVGDEDPREGFLKYLGAEVLRLDQEYPKGVEALEGAAKGVWVAWCQAVGEVVAEVGKEISEDLKKSANGYLLWGLGRFAVKLWDQRASSVKYAKAREAAVALNVQKLRDHMGELLRAITKVTDTQRVLLLVDDLDRTRPEYAVATLDSLYHLFMPNEGEAAEGWPLSSVWAVNIAMLEEFLYAHYRDQPSFDSTAYLAKLFHRRINVPPLFHRDPRTFAGTQAAEQEGATALASEAARLWQPHLDDLTKRCRRKRAEPLQAQAEMFKDGETAEVLSRELSYAVLGNLRLYAAVRRLCTEYWGWRIGHPLELAGDLNRQRLVRDARLITLVQAFPGFREDIALYSGMWPQFVNRVNERQRQVSFEAVKNPAYRHIDDPNLLTLLMDLDVLEFDSATGCYQLDRDGEERLTRELGDLLLKGF